MYLLPAIDILGGRVVRLAKGNYNCQTTYNEDPIAQAKIFEAQGATWIHVVDLDGAKSGKPDNIALIEGILAKTQLNVEVGGGIRTLNSISRLLDAGVSRIVLGTALVKEPAFGVSAVDEFGADKLCVGLDAESGEVKVTGWTEGSGISAHDFARQMSELGFKHMVYTDIARDGMQTGINVQAYEEMALAFGNPVIASGGVASVADIEALSKVANSIEGVIAGRAIYEGTLSVAEGIAACS